MSAGTSVALYQLGYDPNSRHSINRARDVLHDIEKCKKFLEYADPDHSYSDKNIPYEVDVLLRKHSGMPALTKPEFFGTGKEAPMATKAKAKAKTKAATKPAGRKVKFSKIKLIGLNKSIHKRGFNEGSLISNCFELVGNNMTIVDYKKAASKKKINAAKASGALSKLAKYGIVELVA